jgi:hypothetical protein
VTLDNRIPEFRGKAACPHLECPRWVLGHFDTRQGNNHGVQKRRNPNSCWRNIVSNIWSHTRSVARASKLPERLPFSAYRLSVRS